MNRKNEMNGSIIGKTFTNNVGLDYTVVEKIRSSKRQRDYNYKVKFVKSGFEKVTTKQNVLAGQIKDKLSVSVSGIGLLGNVKMVNHMREYKIWRGMLDRCYDKKNKRYKSYGGKGVTVCERWLTFENFLADIQNIDGFDNDKFHSGMLVMDKDIKQLGIEHVNKVYSLQTCTFVTKEENTKYVSKESIKVHFKAISPSGLISYEKGIVDFCKKYPNLHKSSVLVAMNKRRSYRGWMFERITEEQYLNCRKNNYIKVYLKEDSIFRR